MGREVDGTLGWQGWCWCCLRQFISWDNLLVCIIRNVLTGKEAKTEILHVTRILYFWLMLKLLDYVIIPRFDIFTNDKHSLDSFKLFKLLFWWAWYLQKPSFHKVCSGQPLIICNLDIFKMRYMWFYGGGKWVLTQGDWFLSSYWVLTASIVCNSGFSSSMLLVALFTSLGIRRLWTFQISIFLSDTAGLTIWTNTLQDWYISGPKKRVSNLVVIQDSIWLSQDTVDSYWIIHETNLRKHCAIWTNI